MILGDFNIDIEQDGEKADTILEWMDSCCIGPVVPDSNTSLRSGRTIDYAASICVDLTIQAYEGDTTSDHKSLLGVLVGNKTSTDEESRTIWPVFTLILSYIFDYWGKMEQRTRSQRNIFLNHARPSIPQNLVKLHAQSRSLSFKAKRKSDIELRKEARRLRNLPRFELKSFHKEQLVKQLKEMHLPGETSGLFRSKTKNHLRQVSSSLKGFFSSSGEIIKDSQIMANMVADHCKRLFEAPVMTRRHPYVDAPPVQWENAAEPIPTDWGILPGNQSGFRAGFRLQTREFLLIEHISSYMPNSSLTATAFVDFKSAFDQLRDRKAVIEVHGNLSRWIKINRGGHQGSSVTPTLFITYHNDMGDFMPGAMSFFFADDLSAVLTGQIGNRFKNQRKHLECRLHTLFEQLEFYAILAVQPIN
ncbi:unnamed protein product [Rotaria socialis]|uniref:Reverse transcriptase domain-containing protein n=1 Tax=Rotaria socialis TaxID=392032 RepID=A0A820T1S6_9BILA|nr:unnamed protein product [Rotaria socialis]